MAKQAYVYSGTDWVPLASEVTNLSGYYTKGEVDNLISPMGLVYISTTTVGSAVSTISLPTGTFTSTYDSYRVIFDASTTTAVSSTAVRFKFRASGVDDSTATSYNHTGFIATPSVLSLNNDSSTHSFCGSFQSSTPERFATQIDLHGIALAKETKFFCEGGMMDGGTRRNITSYGFHNVQTAFDSMTFNLDSGTITGGKIRVYGFKN